MSDEIIHKEKLDVIIETRVSGARVFAVAKVLEDRGVEVHTVLGKTGVIIGRMLKDDDVNVQVYPLVRRVEFVS